MQTNVDATAVEVARRTLLIETEGLRALTEQLSGELGQAVEKAVALIRGASGRVIVSGIGKSGHIGRKLAATLASTGTPSFFVHASEASHGDLGMILGGDIILALSWSGETKELHDLIQHATRFNVPLVAITANAESALGSAANVVLALPRATEACPHGLAPTTSTTMQLALGDALAVALLESRGFTAQDFKVFHPGGKLGAMLSYVRDLMHGRDATPLVPIGTPMTEAIIVMSAKTFGCVGVTGRDGELAGIITDGDLRRHMGPDLLARTVDEVMTTNPRSISPDTLATVAIERMNSTKILTLFVVDDNRPVGLIHIHDLLRAGVV
ncbi:KpsF/GutQ family sugar-phosphate isomerase [Agaricicola taiwanensis]|uniref:KpsF/GutQ family sugar-phosphate isomerase n=1 Tax=Agaricicola taiwanensis TaxID=591372 RepID=UPI00280B84C0|nr:KpsF/GutQ family sugar-phosphate isomerase [Agaricicola taiwanensis]